MKYNYATYTFALKRMFQTFLLIFILSTYAQAQAVQVTGRITSNQSDSAVSGATITVKGTKTGVAANENGSPRPGLVNTGIE